jgi:hypothetical protein
MVGINVKNQQKGLLFIRMICFSIMKIWWLKSDILMTHVNTQTCNIVWCFCFRKQMFFIVYKDLYIKIWRLYVVKIIIFSPLMPCFYINSNSIQTSYEIICFILGDPNKIPTLHIIICLHLQSLKCLIF